jgi:peptidoglycan/xylan/chitin deacetylase (PgdA/CDA1 family)
VIEAIARRLGAPTRDAGAPRGLTTDELRRLAASPRVEIGAHGASPARLAQLPAAAQRRDIEECRQALERAIGRAPRAFSYPNGSNDRVTRELVREAGFACAFASGSGVATAGADRFALPRFWVGRLDAPALARLLRSWG